MTASSAVSIPVAATCCVMSLREFFSDVLYNPTDLVGYCVSRRLGELYPAKAIVEGEATSFNIEAFVRAEQCVAVGELSVHNQIATEWVARGKRPLEVIENGWFNVLWKGQLIDVVLVTWSVDGCRLRRYWIIADSRDLGIEFFQAVCDWNGVARGEILVFEGGCWKKDTDLFNAIRSSSFANLVLRPGLVEEIRSDFEKFFVSRSLYEDYSIPWKRGVLFIGPPGTGKTHTVKALVNHLRQPCLYVKSFDTRYETSSDNIRAAFDGARQATPCIMVLEDLDSLVDVKSRSFFLNEMDGFASNHGLVVLATTNHAERLDPAIVDRPSRFDRKYYFGLPASTERLVYISTWNDSLKPELRLTAQGLRQIADLTDGFSFAYLKELFVSSMMQWMNDAGRIAMDEVTHQRVVLLRREMSELNDRQETEERPDD